MALGQKTGGRQLGARNKTRAINRAMVGDGLMPIDYMLEILRDEGQTDENRKWAANAAAPYLHAKLASTEQKLSGEVAISQIKRIIVDPQQP